MSQHKVNIDYDDWTATIDNQTYPLVEEKSTVGATALQVRKKIARDFRRELEAVPWLKNSEQDTPCNEDSSEVTLEGEEDDNVFPFTIRLQKEINLEPRQQTCFYATLFNAATNQPVEDSDVCYEVHPRSDLEEMLLTAHSVGRVRQGKFPITLCNISNVVVPFEGNEVLGYASPALIVERPDSVAGAAHVRHSKKAAMNEEDMLREKALLKRHCEQPSFPEAEERLIRFVVGISTCSCTAW